MLQTLWNIAGESVLGGLWSFNISAQDNVPSYRNFAHFTLAGMLMIGVSPTN